MIWFCIIIAFRPYPDRTGLNGIRQVSGQCYGFKCMSLFSRSGKIDILAGFIVGKLTILGIVIKLCSC